MQLNFSYIELNPQFTCTRDDGTSFECKHDDFYSHNKCDPTISVEPDMDHSDSLYNWTYDMELWCISSFEMGLFGSLYFVGKLRLRLSSPLYRVLLWIGDLVANG